MCRLCCPEGDSAGRRHLSDRRLTGSVSRIGIARARQWVIGILDLVDVDRRQEEAVQDIEEAARRTGEVEVGVEAQDREEAEVQVEATEIGTMIARASGRGAIRAVGRRLLDGAVEAHVGALGTTVAAGAQAAHHHLQEEAGGVLQLEAEGGGEASPATAAAVGAPVENAAAEEGGDEIEISLKKRKDSEPLRRGRKGNA